MCNKPIKVITYGTYDLLHHGHVRLLERAKSLGDYLIVGVTADDFDRTRGKINVEQPLMERVEAVRSLGIADEIIIEEYEGQKIDDIKRLNIDIFTVGSDWEGTFDYLNEYCKVIYLPRTDGVSSSELRAENRHIKLGIVGESNIINKFVRECSYVNGVEINCICINNRSILDPVAASIPIITNDFNLLLECVDAVYLISHPSLHFSQAQQAIKRGKHVLCESPMALTVAECHKLYEMAKESNTVLYEAIKTAYSTAYSRMILLAKSGKIGEVLSVDSVCTSLNPVDYSDKKLMENVWNSLSDWGPTALLPVFQLLGTDYSQKEIISRIADEDCRYDEFSKVTFIYPTAVASIKVGKGVKSEGELIISGTKGYIYVPSPWWKMDYFEIRYENPNDNRRYFYHLEGEGIRLEIAAFIKAIDKCSVNNISPSISYAISSIMESYENNIDTVVLKRDIHK